MKSRGDQLRINHDKPRIEPAGVHWQQHGAWAPGCQKNPWRWPAPAEPVEPEPHTQIPPHRAVAGSVQDYERTDIQISHSQSRWMGCKNAQTHGRGPISAFASPAEI